MIKRVWEVEFIERDVWKGRRIVNVDHGVDRFFLEVVITFCCSIGHVLCLRLWMDFFCSSLCSMKLCSM